MTDGEPQPPRPEPVHTSPGGTLVSLIIVIGATIIVAILYYLVKTKRTQKSLLQGSQSLNEQETQQSILEG